jgi:aminoglycoside phosphotransferase (APT) family kinase protein
VTGDAVEAIDLDLMSDALTAWGGDLLEGSGAVQVTRLAEGHSNLTFILSRSGSPHEWVLRRPPLGPLLPSAHDVLREARVITALAGQGVRLPAGVGSDDGSVLGAPFYVMVRAAGAVVREELPDWLPDEASRRTLGLDLVDTLAELHAADAQPVVAAGLGRPGGYLMRQHKRWAGQREGVREMAGLVGLTARELPDYDVVRDWLAARLPALDVGARVSVVHGDYKLDNVLVDTVALRITAILDWEMATVGDPLADLGYLLAMSPRPDNPPLLRQLTGDVTANPGFPARDEIVERYVATTGADATALGTYEVLALWKMATLLEMSYYRFLAGTSEDPLFPELEWGVPAIYARARSLI